jgi:hypothetical protein
MAISINVNANTNWDIFYNNADELKETPAHYSNIYTDENNNYFVCWSHNNSIKIGTGSGIFNRFYSTSKYLSICNNTMVALVGYYKNGVLIEKENITFYVPSGDMDTAYPYLNKFSRKIIRHLKYVGDVRIVADKYSGAHFDITIPMNSNIIIPTTISNNNTKTHKSGDNTYTKTIEDIENAYDENYNDYNGG